MLTILTMDTFDYANKKRPLRTDVYAADGNGWLPFLLSLLHHESGKGYLEKPEYSMKP